MSTESDPKDYADRIRSVLAENGISQVQAASRLGMHVAAFNRAIHSRSSIKVRQFVCELSGQPESYFWPPPKKRGPKPKNNIN